MIYKILNIPIVYRAAQLILGPGGEKDIVQRLEVLIKDLPMDEGPVLDVGCGPQSWLFKVGYDPIGLDLEPSYVAAYVNSGHQAVVGSATELPFGDGTFQCVWSFGVFHHMPDSVARPALHEAMRVCRPGGAVMIFDSILPRNPWRKPVAYAIRRLDRGHHMRWEEQLCDLLPNRPVWQIEYLAYAATGLEGLFCIYRKPAV